MKNHFFKASSNHTYHKDISHIFQPPTETNSTWLDG